MKREKHSFFTQTTTNTVGVGGSAGHSIGIGSSSASGPTGGAGILHGVRAAAGIGCAQRENHGTHCKSLRPSVQHETLSTIGYSSLCCNWVLTAQISRLCHHFPMPQLQRSTRGNTALCLQMN